ncbi:lantibiotic dehydratase [Paenibacillus tyrfis]|uniref:lantibiotic dehydratase n=1 Tax=Paenibacillus tyrfis TaxID=1501230 RepID=UPI0020A0EDA5|nr:lantibiotic dehydratase [Paenibacillus tyrfis]MCP1308120.1 lantibiotic dehydratase [Paenibacillus tyrfis]
MAKLLADPSPTRFGSLFTTLPFFMIRMPLLPLESFRTIREGDFYIDSLQRLLDTDYVQEAIAVASPSLYEALPHLERRTDERKTKQAASSALKYISRMSTRPTPFGLFAGVAVGGFADTTDVRLNPTEYYRKRTRPDMEWLLQVVHRLEQRPEIVRQLRVTRNDAVQYTGGRLELLYPTMAGQAKQAESGQDNKISVRATPPAVYALELADQPVKFEELIRKLAFRYGNEGTDEQVIADFLWTLFTKEFLISELRPPLTGGSPLDYAIGRLELIQGADEEKGLLSHVRTLIQEYDACPLGEGTVLYRDFTKLMRQHGETASVVQVDLALSSQKIELNRSIGEEAARVGEILWRLSQSQRGFAHLKEYHTRFLEKYGDCCDVPIMELLNEETGLGVPASYLVSPFSRKEESSEKTKRAIEWERLTMEKLAGALLQRQMEIELTDELIERLTDRDQGEDEAPDSIEVYLEVIASSPEAIDKGDYMLALGPNPGSLEAGSTFGRFLDMFDDETRNKVQQIRSRQQQSRPGAIFVEASYIPQYGRTANVMLAPNLRDFEISIGTNSAAGKIPLRLDDILVSATSERLYLKSASMGKEVVVTAGHMLNFQQSPPVYRFMRELSFEGVRTWQPFEWGRLEQFVFLPRVRYGRTILSPAKWNLYPHNVSSAGKMGIDGEWHERFAAWKNEWMVPRYVYMVYTDHRILLDLENKEFIDEVRKELLANQHVVFHEMTGSFEERWVSGTGGRYNMECVVQLEKRQDSSRSVPISPIVKTCSKEEMVKLPGSDWLFVKLYGGEDRQDEFITGAIVEFAESALQNEAVDSWFYMRYKDPAPHIRLRFHGQPNVLLGKLLPSLHDWANACMKEGLIQKLSIDTYEREVGRYGGLACISDAERVFFGDSRAAAALIRLLRYTSNEWPNYVVAAASAIQIMSEFGLNYSEQLDVLNRMIDKNDYRDDYRPWRREMISVLGSDQWQELRKRPGGETILQSFEHRSAALRAYGERVAEEKRNRRLWNETPNIISSLMHMHCNRLLGINQDLEKKSLAFAGHALDSLLQYWKHVK